MEVRVGRREFRDFGDEPDSDDSEPNSESVCSELPLEEPDENIMDSMLFSQPSPSESLDPSIDSDAVAAPYSASASSNSEDSFPSPSNP